MSVYQVFKMDINEFIFEDDIIDIKNVYVVISNMLVKNQTEGLTVQLQIIGSAIQFNDNGFKIVVSDDVKEDYTKDDIMGLIYESYEIV